MGNYVDCMSEKQPLGMDVMAENPNESALFDEYTKKVVDEGTLGSLAEIKGSQPRTYKKGKVIISIH